MGGSKPWLKPGEVPKCKSRCIHSGKIGDAKCCLYIFDTDRIRPCPPGPDCTEYKRGKRRRKDPNHWED